MSDLELTVPYSVYNWNFVPGYHQVRHNKMQKLICRHVTIHDVEDTPSFDLHLVHFLGEIQNEIICQRTRMV